MNNFLQNRTEIDNCVNAINKVRLVQHGCWLKNWDIANVIPLLTDGNLLDMGAFCSWVLHNAVKLGITGVKWGIDLTPITDRQPGCFYWQCDLCETIFRDGHFQNITCLSVIEHGVDFVKFLTEASRLLKVGGHLYLTFDYWEPKWHHAIKDWNILDRSDVEGLIATAKALHLEITSPVDWKTSEAPIHGSDYYPVNGVDYTFGSLAFVRV